MIYNKLCAFAVVFALVAAGPAVAQIPDVHVEPYAGIFVPLNQIADADVLGFTFQVDHQEALPVGGRATIFPRQVDLDSYLAYARPTVASSDFNDQLQLDSELQTDLVFSGGLQFTFDL